RGYSGRERRITSARYAADDGNHPECGRMWPGLVARPCRRQDARTAVCCIPHSAGDQLLGVEYDLVPRSEPQGWPKPHRGGGHNDYDDHDPVLRLASTFCATRQERLDWLWEYGLGKRRRLLDPGWRSKLGGDDARWHGNATAHGISDEWVLLRWSRLGFGRYA